MTTTNASYHFIITQSGSYYLSANLGVTKTDGIQINADVTQGGIPGNNPPEQLAFTAACVGLFVYVVGTVAGFFLPEPGEEGLSD